LNSLLKQVLKLKKGPEGKKIIQRLEEFKSFKQKHSNDWFTELCFCILTANSKASTAIKVHDELGFKGFSEFSEKKVSEVIRRNGHRFHNNKAHYIVLAREFLDIRFILSGYLHEGEVLEAREWLVENIKGIGYKEASHYLRNVGYFNLAILDRHILNLMQEYGYIKNKPKILTKKVYLELEQEFFKLAKEVNMSPAELDMYMWCIKAGAVLR
jgi:N-glycosylase/DNA lyase